MRESFKTCEENFPERSIEANDFLENDAKRRKYLLKDEFRELKQQLKKNDYTNSISCYEISKDISNHLNLLNVKCEKIFAIARKNRVADVWNNHQATIFRKEATRAFKGKRIEYLQTVVIDPMLEKVLKKNDKFFFLDEWFTLVTKVNLDDTLPDFNHLSYIIFPSTYYKPYGTKYFDFFNPCDYLFENEVTESDKVNEYPLIILKAS